MHLSKSIHLQDQLRHNAVNLTSIVSPNNASHMHIIPCTTRSFPCITRSQACISLTSTVDFKLNLRNNGECWCMAWCSSRQLMRGAVLSCQMSEPVICVSSSIMPLILSSAHRGFAHIPKALSPPSPNLMYSSLISPYIYVELEVSTENSNWCVTSHPDAQSLCSSRDFNFTLCHMTVVQNMKLTWGIPSTLRNMTVVQNMKMTWKIASSKFPC